MRWMIVLIITIVLVFCACDFVQFDPTHIHLTSPTTSPTIAPSSTPMTEPQPTRTELLECDGTPIDDETLRYFEQEVFTYPSWYNMILTAKFSSPEDADLYLIFYNGIGDNGEMPGSTELTQEETEYFADHGYEVEYAYSRIPEDQMNAVLLRYLGIPLDASNKLGLDRFIYVESTSCYYHKHTDSNMLMDLTIDGGYTLDDGTIYLYYTKDKNSNPRFTETCVVVLRPVYDQGEQRYQVLSNQTIE